MFPVMLFPKGDPREACAIAEDAEQAKALRAAGYRTLDESGMHPDQFKAFPAVNVGDVLTAPDGRQFQVVAEAATSAPPAKRGPGRPRKE